LIVILCLFAVNGEAQTESTRVTSTAAQAPKALANTRTTSTKTKKPCCETGCLTCNKCNKPLKKTNIKRSCVFKRISRCFERKRCCQETTKCFGGYCKTSRKICKLVGKKRKTTCLKIDIKVKCTETSKEGCIFRKCCKLQAIKGKNSKWICKTQKHCMVKEKCFREVNKRACTRKNCCKGPICKNGKWKCPDLRIHPNKKKT